MKTLKYLIVSLILFFVFLLIAINTQSFQTWLAKKATHYLTEKLGTKVEIGSVNLSFISNAELENVFIEDDIHDTLLFSENIHVKLNNFIYSEKKLTIQSVKLKNTSVFIVKHKNKADFNFQHLADFFASSDSSTSTKSNWELSYGDLILDNVRFTYRNEHYDNTVSQNMNYDNIYVSHVFGELKNIQFYDGNILADIQNLQAHEQCGINLEHLNTSAKISSKSLICKKLDLKTSHSIVNGSLAFSYGSWKDYIDFVDSVKINGMLLDGTQINFKDIAYFAPELNGLDTEIKLYGKLDGYVSDFEGQSLYLKFGDNSLFTGDLKMKGLPNIKSTYINFNAQNLITSKKDLEKIPLYPFSSKELLKLPIEVGHLGEITYSGQFDGYFNDFVSKGKFKTALGNAILDVSINIDTIKNKIKYEGLLISDHFKLGKLLNQPSLGGLSINTKIKGSGITLNELDAELQGRINDITYNNYVYQNININGNVKKKIFHGELESRDPNADFDFNGSVNFTEKVPNIDFIATINKLNFKRLGFISTKEDGYISSQILMDLKGDNIDNLTGLINFDNTIYTTSEREYKLSTFDLHMNQESAEKRIKVNSNVFNLSIDGLFKISNMPGAFNQFLYAYYPAFVSKPKTIITYNDAFNYKLTIKKFNTIRDLFINDLMLSTNSTFEGNFEAGKNILNLNMKSDSINFKTLRLSNNRIESYSQNNKINLVFKSDKVKITDSISIDNCFMYFVSKDINTKFNLEWDNQMSPKNAGKIFGRTVFENNTATFFYDQFFLTTHDSTWNLVSSHPTYIDSLGKILVNPVVFAKNNQKMSVFGTLSDLPQDKLVFQLSNFDLNQLAPFFGKAINLKGIVDGSFSLHKTMGSIAFSSNLEFQKLNLNNNNLGEGLLKTEYFTADKYIYLDGYTSLGFTNFNGDKIKNIAFNGYYYLERKEDAFDISFEANPANLNILNPLLEGILTFTNSLIVGKAKLTGSPDKPLINGKFKITKCEMRVDYLNVIYNMIGNIEIEPGQIRFDEFKLGDDLTKKNIYNASLNGNIFHNNFKNIRLDYDINFTNMLVLNKSRNETEPFYGKAYGSGNAGIYGFINKVDMQINVKTEKGTLFTIPLDNPSEVTDNNFIKFVVKDTIKKTETEKYAGFTLDMNLDATSDAEAQIIFDEKSGDIIRAKGDGHLNLKINNRGKFDMQGEYAISSGVYMFTLENFLTKKFDIKKGSSITWSGSPYDAEIDIVAIYRQRASLAPLFPYEEGADNKRRLPVECKLIMKETLLQPNITFGVDLPTSDEITKSKVKSILNDADELNRQVFSLLLLKSFVTPLIYSHGGGISGGASSALAANGTEMLSNRLSGWLSNLTKEVDIGVNYRPGNDVSSDELDVALSKQLLDNRLIVDGNFGYNNNQSTNSSSIIGDVNIEYKLTDDGRYRVKGFNRSNDNTQITTNGGPFTQGVGVFYREEFEQFDDIFKRYVKKIKTLSKKPKPEIVPAPEPEG